MRSKLIIGCVVAFACFIFPRDAWSVPVDTATADQHQAEIQLIQELNNAIAQLDGEIASQQKMLTESTADHERGLINAQIKTLEKHKNMLSGFVGEFTGELKIKGVPVEELLAEQRRERREKLEEELEQQIVNRHETERLDKT